MKGTRGKNEGQMKGTWKHERKKQGTRGENEEKKKGTLKEMNELYAEHSTHIYIYITCVYIYIYISCVYIYIYMYITCVYISIYIYICILHVYVIIDDTRYCASSCCAKQRLEGLFGLVVESWRLQHDLCSIAASCGSEFSLNHP